MKNDQKKLFFPSNSQTKTHMFVPFGYPLIRQEAACPPPMSDANMFSLAGKAASVLQPSVTTVK